MIVVFILDNNIVMHIMKHYKDVKYVKEVIHLIMIINVN